MPELKNQIFEIIKTSSRKAKDRSTWLGPEVAELGVKHSGLDDVNFDSILIMATLFMNDGLDDSEIIKFTEISPSNFGNAISTLSEYDFVDYNPPSEKYQLTDKGKSSCRDIFKNVVTRKRLEIKRELENIEHLYFKLSEI